MIENCQFIVAHRNKTIDSVDQPHLEEPSPFTDYKNLRQPRSSVAKNGLSSLWTPEPWRPST